MIVSWARYEAPRQLIKHDLFRQERLTNDLGMSKTSSSREGARISMKKPRPENNRQDEIIAEARLNRELREKAYREQALRMYPWICARCGREFAGKKLRELTVHHKDHNHDNNPPDGSNWELLCLYCHDNEHQKYLDEESFGKTTPDGVNKTPATHRPFATLGDLLKDKKTKSGSAK